MTASPFDPPSLPQPCRTALIGVTGYGQVHLQHLLETTQAGWTRPVAAVVINPEEAAEACQTLQQQGARIYPDQDSLWAAEKGRVDLCLIPTGIHWHAPMSMAALEAGADVLVEKPLSGTVEEAEAMIRTSEKTGRFIAVGYQDLYDPNILHLKQQILDGKLGTIRRIRGWALWPRQHSYYQRNSWAGETQGWGLHRS
ncbi:MAG: Gfo/Idh/MocA family oxidoreductase [Blastochloris sp.]|nr:Gfo/Idh/MocA family oxidoreductase [Blastochloris sp.]